MKDAAASDIASCVPMTAPIAKPFEIVLEKVPAAATAPAFCATAQDPAQSRAEARKLVACGAYTCRGQRRTGGDARLRPQPTWLRRRPHAASNGRIYTGVSLYNDIAAAIAKMAADAAKEAAKGAKEASAKLAGELAAALALAELNGHGDLSKLKAVQVTALLKYKFGHEKVPTRKGDMLVALACHASELGVRVPL